MMDEKTLDLKVLRGSPVDVGKCKVYPLKLGDIEEIGEQRFNQILSILCLKPKDKIEIDGYELNTIETIIVYSCQQSEFKDILLYGLSKIIRESVHLHDDGFFYFGEANDQRILDNNTFEKIVKVVKKQNFLKDVEEEKEIKPLNDKAKELQDKLKAIKEKIKQQNNDEGLNLSDIISIVSAYTSNINIFSVWDLTVYQLYMLYLRLLMRDTYESNFYLLPHVTDSKSLDLKHWATKIQQ